MFMNKEEEITGVSTDDIDTKDKSTRVYKYDPTDIILINNVDYKI